LQARRASANRRKRQRHHLSHRRKWILLANPAALRMMVCKRAGNIRSSLP
jgi:hypothetical protein